MFLIVTNPSIESLMCLGCIFLIVYLKILDVFDALADFLEVFDGKRLFVKHVSNALADFLEFLDTLTNILEIFEHQ